MKLTDLLEKIAPLPWKLDGTDITDGGPNIIAVGCKGWSDDKDNTAYLHHAANALPELVAASRALLGSVTTPEEFQRFKDALAKAEDVSG